MIGTREKPTNVSRRRLSDAQHVYFGAAKMPRGRTGTRLYIYNPKSISEAVRKLGRLRLTEKRPRSAKKTEGVFRPLEVGLLPDHPLQVGVKTSLALTAIAGTPPYAWSVTSGILPPGMTLSKATGVITGTPNSAGTFQFTSHVT